MRELKNILFSVSMMALLTGCVKDELHHTPHPDRGAVWITTDWSGISADAVQPESYLLRIGETSHAVSGTNNTFEELLTEDKYTLLVHNMPRGITVGTQTATVHTLSNGTLEPNPDYLFSAVQELQVIKDDTLRVNAKMVQGIRKLTLLLTLNEGDAERIASSRATLTGIAHTVDLSTGTPIAPQTGKAVVPTFEKATIVRVSEANALAATLQLAGVVGGEQQLFKIVVTLTDGTTVTVESDLTEALKDFAGSNLPFTLNAELPMPKPDPDPDPEEDVEFSGTITSWEEVDNGNITIH